MRDVTNDVTPFCHATRVHDTPNLCSHPQENRTHCRLFYVSTPNRRYASYFLEMNGFHQLASCIESPYMYSVTRNTDG